MKNKNLIMTAALTIGMTVNPGTLYANEAQNDTWAIYWYLCGSDLESEGGAATADIYELLDVELPDQVTVVIETGGASEWDNSFVDPDYLERYVYDSEGLNLVDQVESANMGAPETLTDFLSFCEEYYPADHTMVVFWNHGAGSTGGAAFDELYDGDSLTLDEMHDAFASVYDLSDGTPIDVVGFDTCLMATIDTAKIFSDVADYLVASEETEPGCGWDYKGWIGALAEDPSMDGAELGTNICDTYAQWCGKNDLADEITLSVTDLNKVEDLLEAYEMLGQEALANQSENAYFYTEFCRNTEQAENYGGNTDSAGYTNMVDLGDLVRKNQDCFPDNADEVLEALDDCIVYKINGHYRQEATGLSCYYSFNNDEEDLEAFKSISASNSFAGFYEYCLLDGTTAEMEDWFENMDFTIADLLPVETFATYQNAQIEDEEEPEIPVEIDEDGNATIQIEEEILNLVQGVYFNLGYVDEDAEYLLWLGSDNNIDMDWDNGIFKDNFTGTWGCLDGHLCYMDIVYEGEDYNLYYVPILLNGQEYQLHVVYDYNTEGYSILGARKGLEDNGMADRNLIQLKDGDEITMLMYQSDLSGNKEDELVWVDEFVVDGEPVFMDEEMGDGSFVMMFYMKDCRGMELTSDIIWFTVEDGEITTEV